MTATDLIQAYNAWAPNDLDVTPAAVTTCTVSSLPTDPRTLMRLIPEPHRSFFDSVVGPTYEALTFTPTQTSDAYDPTADRLPASEDSEAGQRAQSTATTHFAGRPIQHTQATGSTTDLLITLQIALDPTTSQLFTFIQGLSD